MHDYAERIHTLRHCASEPYVGKCGDCPMDGIELCQDIVMREAADAIEELLAAVPRWISVEERLPEIYRRVLTYSKTRGVIQNHRCGDSSWWIGFHITHWMPLPEPPKEETK